MPFLHMSQRSRDSVHLVWHRPKGHLWGVFCRLRWPKFPPKSATQKCSSLKAIMMHGRRAVNSHLPFLHMSQRSCDSLHLICHRRKGHQCGVFCSMRWPNFPPMHPPKSAIQKKCSSLKGINHDAWPEGGQLPLAFPSYIIKEL